MRIERESEGVREKSRGEEINSFFFPFFLSLSFASLFTFTEGSQFIKEFVVFKMYY